MSIFGRIKNIVEAEMNYNPYEDLLNPRPSSNPNNTSIDKFKNLVYTVNNAVQGLTYTPPEADVVYDLSKLNRADHIYVWRPGYLHHGIYLGEGQVIHYADYIIKVNRLDEFRKRNFLDPTAILSPNLPLCQVRRMPESESPKRYSDDEIIRRAFSRLGETEYDLLYNNCEHFARWCRYGD